MNNLKALGALLIGLTTLSAQAHHAIAVHYDRSSQLELTGVVTEFMLRSPHAYIFMDVENDAGEIEQWEIEGGSAAHMQRAGVSNDTLKVGDTITIVALANRDPENSLVYGVRFLTEEGPVGGQAAGENGPAVDVDRGAGVAKLNGRWRAPYPTGITSPPMAMNQAARTAWENYDPQTSPASSCEPISLPEILHAPYLNDVQISDNEVVFHHEVYDVTRTLPLGAEPQSPESSGYYGLAAARIEGDTLVIESDNYPASGWGIAMAVQLGAGADIPSSEQKTLVTRYTPSDDGLTMSVDYILEDPAYLTEPYAGHAEWTRVADDEPLYDYVCEADNAARFALDP